MRRLEGSGPCPTEPIIKGLASPGRSRHPHSCQCQNRPSWGEAGEALGASGFSPPRWVMPGTCCTFLCLSFFMCKVKIARGQQINAPEMPTS